jgi:hypothetical protein
MNAPHQFVEVDGRASVVGLRPADLPPGAAAARVAIASVSLARALGL